jgi:DNA-directed RNA polymerase III subunit RPC1
MLVGALKVIHEKFKKKTKNLAPEEAAFKATFNNAVQLDPYLKGHISKAHHDLNPLVVQSLFERISSEVL